MNVILRLKTNDAGKFETVDYTTIISGHHVPEHPVFLEPAQCWLFCQPATSFWVRKRWDSPKSTADMTSGFPSEAALQIWLSAHEWQRSYFFANVAETPWGKALPNWCTCTAIMVKIWHSWMVQLDWRISTTYMILYGMKASLFWVLYLAEKVC